MERAKMSVFWCGVVLAFMVSCFPITINVYFPETKIESAAAQIESEIRGDTGQQGQGTSWRLPRMRLAWGIPQAFAQEPDLKVDTPAIQEIKNTRKARFPQIDELLTKAFVGEGKDGLLKEKDSGVLQLKELAQARKLVKEENADRLRLYKEIATENGFPEEVSRIQEIFGRENRKQIKIGQYYEDDDGTWKQKKE
ncbi:MAG TPA: DUF1318 domain-containing protein [bacterium]|nr:DUF1318 domain-containing protein [bacterium]